ncbi:hypothetical protein ACFQH6_20570 [Halobacteriaceae archaeon GCM10025711]
MTEYATESGYTTPTQEDTAPRTRDVATTIQHHARSLAIEYCWPPLGDQDAYSQAVALATEAIDQAARDAYVGTTNPPTTNHGQPDDHQRAADGEVVFE